MFQASTMLFIYVETPLHAGTGRGFGAVDLPIQRERTTDYPMIQASGIKGRLRAETHPKFGRAQFDADEEQRRLIHKVIFGPETQQASEHAGALGVGDARLLLFPVRSLSGVFAWTTSREALARFVREAALAQLPIPWSQSLLSDEPPTDGCWVNGDTLVAGETVVLEEFAFTPQSDAAATVQAIGTWLAGTVFPQTDEYEYWRAEVPKKLCILPENAFRDFVRYGTEIQTHVRISTETKTVEGGALWTSESLPVDTVMYAPLLATDGRANGAHPKLKAGEVLKQMRDAVKEQGLNRIQLGGDETTGQGIVALHVTEATGGGQ